MSPYRRYFPRTALLLVGCTVLISVGFVLKVPGLAVRNLGAAAPTSMSGEITDAKCASLIAMAGSAGGTERSFALSALSKCRTSPEISRVLRNAVLEDDYRSRTRALEALGYHLQADMVPFLTALLHGPRPLDNTYDQAEERVLIYDYLERLAGPTHYKTLLAVFRRGLYGSSDEHARNSILEFLGRHGFLPDEHAREKLILLSSLRGLGRIRAVDEWPRMLPFLGNRIKDADILTAALEGAALLPFPRSRAGAVVGRTRHLLFHPHDQVRGAAIRFFAGLPSVHATESLMVLFVKLNPPGQRALLEQSLRTRLRLDGTGGRPGIVPIPARLHILPAERGSVVGVLDEYTVVYRDSESKTRHRLRPSHGRPGAEARWHLVRTSSGLRGWLHAHRVLYPRLESTPATK